MINNSRLAEVWSMLMRFRGQTTKDKTLCTTAESTMLAQRPKEEGKAVFWVTLSQISSCTQAEQVHRKSRIFFFPTGLMDGLKPQHTIKTESVQRGKKRINMPKYYIISFHSYFCFLICGHFQESIRCGSKNNLYIQFKEVEALCLNTAENCCFFSALPRKKGCYTLK